MIAFDENKSNQNNQFISSLNGWGGEGKVDGVDNHELNLERKNMSFFLRIRNSSPIVGINLTKSVVKSEKDCMERGWCFFFLGGGGGVCKGLDT